MKCKPQYNLDSLQLLKIEVNWYGKSRYGYFHHKSPTGPVGDVGLSHLLHHPDDHHPDHLDTDSLPHDEGHQLQHVLGRVAEVSRERRVRSLDVGSELHSLLWYQSVCCLLWAGMSPRCVSDLRVQLTRFIKFFQLQAAQKEYKKDHVYNGHNNARKHIH